MNIRITGRTEGVTAGMKSKAAKKVEKLSRYYDRITWVDVVLGEARGKCTVEMTAGLNRGTTLVARAGSSDMYAAIDLAIDKISRQIRKHKEKLADHRPKRGETVLPPAEEADEAEED